MNDVQLSASEERNTDERNGAPSTRGVPVSTPSQSLEDSISVIPALIEASQERDEIVQERTIRVPDYWQTRRLFWYLSNL